MTRKQTTTLPMLLIAAAAAGVLAGPAYAQSDTAPGTAVSFSGGAASTSSKTGVALGGSVLFDLNDHASIEVQGKYLDRGSGVDAFDATASIVLNFVSARKRTVPYAALGGGIYHAAFDLGNPRFMGSAPNAVQSGSVVCPAPGSVFGPGPGRGVGPGAAQCTGTDAGYWGVGQMPRFYGQRLGPLIMPADGRWPTRSFTDPALSIGGGLRINVNDRVMLRPDIRALVIFAGGDTYTMTVLAINAGYRF